MKKTISVILPIYKAELYLENCVNSILEQTFRDFEIILVDDGSPDKSGIIADDFAKKYECIKVHHQVNKGVTAARAKGVDISEGEWICFVDPDDTLPKNSLLDLYSPIASGIDTDIVIGYKQNPPKNSQIIKADDFINRVINCDIVSPCIWGRIYRKELFNSFIFDIPREINKGEDLLMNIRIGNVNTKDIYVLNKIIYNYIQHEESCMHTFKHKIEYETLYYKYLLTSIPISKRDTYSKALICSRINGLSLSLIDKPWLNLFGNDYYLQLKKDIKSYSYPIGSKEKFLFNPLLRIILRLKIFTKNAIKALIAILRHR